MKGEGELESLWTYNHALAFCIVVDDLIHLFEVDGAAFVNIDGVEPLLVSFFVPHLVRVGVGHEFLAETSALVDVQISIAIIVSL